MDYQRNDLSRNGDAVNAQRPCLHWMARLGFVCVLCIATGLASLLPLMATISSAFAQAPTVTVSPETIYLGDTVTVDIEVTASRRVRFGTPEGTELRVVGQRSFSSQSWINGQASFNHRLALQLQPVRAGMLSTGRIPYETEAGLQYVEPVTVNVLDPAERAGKPSPQQGTQGTQGTPRATERPVRDGAASAPLPDLDRIPQAPPLQDSSMFHGALGSEPPGSPFLAAWVSTDSAFPGQQIIVDYLLFSPAGGFGFEITGMSEPLFTDAWFEDISEQRMGNARGRFLQTANVNNQLYEVRPIRSYVLIPLEQGNLEIPPLQLDIQLSGFGRNASPSSLTSNPLQVPVNHLPRQTDGTPSEGASVGFLQMTARVDRNRVRVGDSGTLIVEITGVSHFTGLLMPAPQPPAGIGLFSPEDNSQSRFGGSGWLEGTITRRIPFVASSEGTWTIPSTTLRYYDPWREVWTTRTTDPIEIIVEGVNEAAVAAANEGSGVAVDWRSALPAPRVVNAPRQQSTATSLPPEFWTALIALPPLVWLVLLAVSGIGRVRLAGQPARHLREATTALADALTKAADANDSQAVLTAIRRYVGELNRQHSLAHPLTNDGMLQTAAHLQNPIAAELAELHAEVASQRYGGESSLSTSQLSAIRRLAQAARGAK